MPYNAICWGVTCTFWTINWYKIQSNRLIGWGFVISVFQNKKIISIWFHLTRKEMCEFRKLLHHLNKKTARPVCFFTVLNITYAIAGFAYLIKTYIESNAPIKMFSLNVGNILLWLIIAFYPFFQVILFEFFFIVFHQSIISFRVLHWPKRVWRLEPVAIRYEFARLCITTHRRKIWIRFCYIRRRCKCRPNCSVCQFWEIIYFASF